jgi:hypothetical protein
MQTVLNFLHFSTGRNFDTVGSIDGARAVDVATITLSIHTNSLSNPYFILLSQGKGPGHTVFLTAIFAHLPEENTLRLPELSS